MRARIRKEMLDAQHRNGTTSGRRFPGRRRFWSASCRTRSWFRCRARPSPRSRNCGTKIRSTPSSICSIEDTRTLRWRYSGCRSRTSRWRCSSRGYRSATIRRAPRRTACWAASIRIHALTGRSRTSCASTCARNTNFQLEDAIRKFSALPAQRMRLTDRGVLKKGMWADIVIFDPATIRDKATFENPNQLSEGMRISCWSMACR